MELTVKAQAEINKLKTEIENDRTARETLEKSRRAATNTYEIKALRKGSDHITKSIYRKEEKIRNIEGIGFSTSEVNAIKTEATAFTVITSDRGLGYRCSTRVGFSKTANCHIEIQIHFFTDFMRNVKCCSSLAGTKAINYLKKISKEELEEKISKGRTVQTSFIGTETKIVPIHNR
jgi:hypothetical protein